MKALTGILTVQHTCKVDHCGVEHQQGLPTYMLGTVLQYHGISICESHCFSRHTDWSIDYSVHQQTG
jgi:hypothetical protein